MMNGYACQNCLYQTSGHLPKCPQCGLHNIFIKKSALPYFTGQAPMPSPLQCLNCGFQSIHRHRQCPQCTKKYAIDQSLNKLVSKGRYRAFNIFLGLCFIASGVFLGIIPFVLRILYRQKILTSGISDFQSLVIIGVGLSFIILGVSSWYKAIFK
jgi:RNA polymerase subunit RPABC4/transcription elongation factor Spt4